MSGNKIVTGRCFQKIDAANRATGRLLFSPGWLREVGFNREPVISKIATQYVIQKMCCQASILFFSTKKT